MQFCAAVFQFGRRCLFGLLVLPAVWAPGTVARASELVLYERQGCPWCAAWEREIGRVYDRTDEARSLPLRRVDIEHATAANQPAANAIRFTPTFVIAQCGREVGRIIGYTGSWQFWGTLDEMIDKLPKAGGKC